MPNEFSTPVANHIPNRNSKEKNSNNKSFSVRKIYIAFFSKW